MSAVCKRRKLEHIDFVWLDEKSFRQGQDYISVMINLVAQRVLEVQPGRDTGAVLKLWELLPDSTRQQVQAEAMDFGAVYAAATRQAVPQALIVYDKSGRRLARCRRTSRDCSTTSPIASPTR